MADRRRPGPSPRTVAVWIVVPIVVLALAVGSAPTARSQTTDTLPDRTYSGGIYFNAGTSLDLDGSGNLDTRINTAGEATLTALEESISGNWKLEGTGVIDGTATYSGVTGEASGSTVITGSGAFSGTTSAGRLSGTSKTTGQWTFGAGGGGITSSIDNTGPIDEPLTDLLNKCSQLLARWDSELPAKLEGPGLTVTGLAAYLVLSDTRVIAPKGSIANRLRGLAKQGILILGEARAGGDGFKAAVKGAALLGDVEKLQADMANKESNCPTDKGFTNILTQVAQDALDAVLTSFENDPTLFPSAKTLRGMIRLGNGTGATGGGAKDTGRAANLEGRVKAQANEAFEEATVISDGSNPNIDEAVALAALGEQQGWNLENSSGITGDDVLAATGN